MKKFLEDDASRLRLLWHEKIFAPHIYPEFPFRPEAWRAVAFNRDVHGNIRLPIEDWRRLLDVLRKRSSETTALLLTPYAEVDGKDPPQPIELPLTVEAIVSQFTNPGSYFPDFFLVGESQSWAVRGDSEFSIIGGEDALISEFIESLGGDSKVLRRMIQEFGVGEEDIDKEMKDYFRLLLAGKGR